MGQQSLPQFFFSIRLHHQILEMYIYPASCNSIDTSLKKHCGTIFRVRRGAGGVRGWQAYMYQSILLRCLSVFAVRINDDHEHVIATCVLPFIIFILTTTSLYPGPVVPSLSLFAISISRVGLRCVGGRGCGTYIYTYIARTFGIKIYRW